MGEISGTPAVRAVPAGNGWQWIVDAWGLFRRQPGQWVLMFVILLAVFAGLAWLGLLGNLAAVLATPILAGGFMVAARSSDQGAPVDVGQLFAGFREKAGPLAMLGLFNLASLLVIALVSGLIMGLGMGTGAMMGGMAGGGHGAMMGGLAGMSASALLAFLVMLALSVPLAAALWFAPALIMFRGTAPLDAVKASFAACLQNLVPFLVYGLAALALGIVASIPLGLGWLVLGPVLGISVYTAYRDIFPG